MMPSGSHLLRREDQRRHSSLGEHQELNLGYVVFEMPINVLNGGTE